MASLSVKYRPQTFNEIVGQQSTIMILKKQIQLNKVKNTMIFSGASGCGKTSLARIFAAELNGSPDTAIEVDAASNRGVENVRAIIETANERSVSSMYKVLIMDEAHMLTTEAWNALLKIIEEPPKYTIFIFCTTNPEKIPGTIINRCQRFEFTKLPSILIKDRLEFICCQEGFTNYEEVVDYISKNCNNQMRDGISLLEQVADADTNLSLDIAQVLTNTISYSRIFDIINDLIDGNETKLYADFEDITLEIRTFNFLVKQLLSVELDISKYITVQSLIYSLIPEAFEEQIKNVINFDNAKQLHTYYCKTLLDLYMQIKSGSDLSKELVLAYLLKMLRLE